TDEPTAIAVAERLRGAVGEQQVDTSAGPLTVTISVGVSARDVADVPRSELLREADHRLYEAKARGRDRVVAG
ncbi:diguanylate cyclase, partial [Euzebya sp.]|uniref:diguanylate cyclase n=1 Tax=Euzebya sp. TaxID=1971409 RepID=UPI003516D97C